MQLTKRLLRLLLALVLASGCLPGAIPAQAEELVTTCPICNQEGCTSDHQNWCTICKKDDCGVDHNAPVICDTCKQENCTSTHEAWCETCKKDDCGVDHNAPVTCTTCGLENCTSTHENWCETCKKDNCGVDHNAPVTCTTCGLENCTSTHENWCETCKKDDCGIDHSIAPLQTSSSLRFLVVYENDLGTINLTGLSVGASVKVRCYMGPLNGPPDTSHPAVNVTSSDPSVFTLSEPDERGVYTLTAVGAGEASINCSEDGTDYSCPVQVTDGVPQLRFLVVGEENLSTVRLTELTIGDTVKIRCLMAPVGGPPDPNHPAANVTSGDTAVFTLSEPDDRGVYTLTAVGEGMAFINCSENGKNYGCPVKVSSAESQTGLYASPEQGRYLPSFNMSTGDTMTLTFYLNQFGNGGAVEVTSSDPDVLSLEKTDDVPTYRVVAGKAGTATVSHTPAEGNTRSMTFTVSEPDLRLLITGHDHSNSISLQGIMKGETVKLRAYVGPNNQGPSVAAPITNLVSGSTDIITLSGPDSDNIYTLTAVGQGSTTLTCEKDGKQYSVPVSVTVPVEADGVLYYQAVDYPSGQAYPKTVVNMSAGSSIQQAFYFGSKLLSAADVTCTGPISVSQGQNGMLTLTATGTGTGYLEFTHDGIVHCLVVNVGRPRPDTEMQEGCYMWLDNDTVIGFGDPGLTPTGGETGVLKMLAQAARGYDDTTTEDERFWVPVCFGAENKTKGQPAAAIMNSVTNVKFSVLCCTNRDGTTPAYVSWEKDTAESYAISEGLNTKVNYLVAPAAKGFTGLIGMTFDLPDGNVTRRISLYMLTHSTFMGKDISITPDISSAKELNVILSSYESLKKYVKTEFPEMAEYVDGASDININLPAGDFTDAIVVAQTIAPFPFRDNYHTAGIPGNPNFRVHLIGHESGKTRLAGLISRGSLGRVMNVSFVSTEGITMNYKGDTFTCGVLADSTWKGDVQYDPEFTALYGEKMGGRDLSSWKNDNGMHLADCDVNLGGCSFDGFDYGIRSTPNGYVSCGSGTFTKCYYGMYVDCEGKIGWGEIANGDSGFCNFKKNVVAVRIKGLQNNITPYELRIHDSDFINNYLEFWIDSYDTTQLQNYYFYRNHYSGNWNKVTGNWYKGDHIAPDGSTVPDTGHRGPKYSPEMNNGVTVNVSGTPSSSTPNIASNRSGDAAPGYWIYDGADQVTRIETGTDLPLAQASLEALGADTDVSVVADNGATTVAVWTFEGGE